MASKSLNIIGHANLGSVFAGIIVGMLAYHLVLSALGLTLADRNETAQLQEKLLQLEAENRELSDELFSPRAILNLPPEDLVSPYDEDADARAEVQQARASALEAGKFLMVIFGANWCQDCRTLYVHLDNDEVADYVKDRFALIHVNVGKFNHNIELAKELGVNLERGIPVAIFFDPQGDVIGITNNGELEPARRYTSKQILNFVRDVAEHSRILAPNAVR